MDEEKLPPVQGAPDVGIDWQKLADVNGVNAAIDALVESGVSPVDAAELLTRAGYELPAGAQPEDVAASAGQSPAPQVRRAEPAMKPTGSVFGLDFIDQINALPEDEARKMYDSLTPVQKRIYDRSFGYDEVTAAKAEQWADEFYKEQGSVKEDKANKPLGPRELQVAMDDVALMRSTIESLRTHEGKSKALGYRGPFNIVAPSYWGGVEDKETGKQKPAAGTAAAGFSSLIDSSRAKVFLPVIQRMRGFGSMQVREAEAAVNSANRLSLELSQTDFDAALAEVDDFADRFEARAKGVPVEQIKKERGVATSAQPAAQEETFISEGFKYRKLPDGSAELAE